MAILETTAMDVGVVNLIPAGAPAGVVTAAVNNSGTLTGANKVIAGAMEDIEYLVISPPFQINGTTQATGSFQVTFTFYAQDGSTVLDTNTFPAQQCSQTVQGNVVGTVLTYRVALPGAASATPFVTQTATPNLSGGTISVPQAPHSVTPSIVITGVCGQLTAGWTLGGHRRNRAG